MLGKHRMQLDTSAAFPRALLAALFAAAMVVCWAPQAHAAAQWLPPSNLGSALDSELQLPDVAMNQAGDAAAVWVSDGVVQVSLRSAGGGFSPPSLISTPGQVPVDPHVAIDGAGGVIAMWQYPGATHTIQASVRPPGGSFGAPESLSTAGQDSRRPQVAMDPSGNAVLIWLKSDDVVQAAVRAAGGGFQGPFSLSVAGKGAKAPQVAMDPAGNAVVVWTDTDKRVRASVRRPNPTFAGASFAVPQVSGLFTSMLNGVTGAQVTMNPAGDAVAVWLHNVAANHQTVFSATSVAGDSFGTAVQISPSSQDLGSPQVGLSQSGDAVAVWRRLNGTYSVESAIRLGTGGSFEPRGDLPSANSIPQQPQPQIAMSPAGHAIAAWRGTTGANTIVQGVARPPGGAFTSPPNNVSIAEAIDAKLPQVAINQDGDGVAIFVRGGFAQAAGYDAAGPQLRGLSTPTSGVAGTPTAWSVSPVDVWSGPPSVVWNFGDGAIATDPSTTHVFAAAGTYAVTVTSTDALGNASSDTRTISIAAAPVPPPPIPPPTDADADGFPEQVDCNDRNAAIRPGAVDTPGNKIDENCDGKDARFPILQSTITLLGQRTPPSRNQLLTVLTIRPALAGSTVRLSCSGGRGCRRFKTITRKITKNAGVRDFSRLLPKRKLLPGAKFEVRVTKPGTAGRVYRLTIFKRKAASRTALCLTPGETKPTVCQA